MEKELIFHILNISETSNEDAVRKAYRTQLRRANPEDNPEGFKRLRQAYEEALELLQRRKEEAAGAGVSEEDEGLSDVKRWVMRVEELYEDIDRRNSKEVWKELLSDPVCEELDTSMDAQYAILDFLMNHIYLPRHIWELLNRTFQYREERENLIQHYPENFIDYMIYCLEHESFLDYELLLVRKESTFLPESGMDEVKKEQSHIDAYFSTYLNLKKRVDNEEGKDVLQALDDLQVYSLYHPFEDVERLRILTKEVEKVSKDSEIPPEVTGQKEEIKRLALWLEERYQKQNYIALYVGEAKWVLGDTEGARDVWQAILERDPDYYGAKLNMMHYWMERHQYYEAREVMIELLEADSRDEKIMHYLKQANDALIPEFQKTLKEGGEDVRLPGEELKIELGWCLFQNDRTKEAEELLRDGVPVEEQSYDYCNLYGRLLYHLDRFADALPFLTRWVDLIYNLVDDGTVETKKRMSRYGNACHILSDCHFQLGHQEEADRLIQEAMRVAKDVWERLGYLHYLANIQIKSGQYENAVDTCDQILVQDERYYPAYLIRQECCYRLHKAQEVVDDYYRAIEIFPGYFQPYLFAAQIFFHYGQYEEVKKVFEQARQNQVAFSDQMKLYEAKTIRNQAADRADRDKARHILAELEKNRGEESCDLEDVSEINYERGLLAWDDEDLDAALAFLKKAIQENPERMQYRIVCGKIYLERKEYKKALQEYKEAGEAYQNNPGLYYDRARCYEGLKNSKLMVENYEKTLQMADVYEDACENLADYYQRRYKKYFLKEDYEKALAYITRQLSVTENCYYLVHRGLIYMDTLELKPAIADFRKALEYVPDDWAAWNNLGCCYKYLGKFQEAIRYFEKAVQCMEGNESVLPYSNMADCYEAQEMYQEAVCCYKRNLEMFPDYLSFWEEVGHLCCYQGKYQEAIEAYEKAKEHGKRYWSNLGNVCLAKGQRLKGIVYYLYGIWKCLKEKSERAKRWKDFGELCMEQLSHYRIAISCFEHAMKCGSGHLEAFECYKYIARCYLLLGKKKKAKAYAQAALECFRNLEPLRLIGYLAYQPYAPARIASMGWIFLCQGETKKAQECFFKMDKMMRCKLCRHAECFESRLYLGWVYKSMGKLEMARQEFEEALHRNPHCKEAREALKKLNG